MPEYIKIDSVFEQMDVLRASGSMPFVSKPVLIHGKRYLDGGISDRIPFRFAESLDCDKLIVILTRDMAYRKKQMSPALIRLWFGKSPIAEKLLQRHEVYNRSVEEMKEWEANGKAVVIRPSSPIEIGRVETDPQKLHSVYDLGVKDGMNYVIHKNTIIGRTPYLQNEPTKTASEPPNAQKRQKGVHWYQNEGLSPNKDRSFDTTCIEGTVFISARKTVAVVCSICGKIHILVLE